MGAAGAPVTSGGGSSRRATGSVESPARLQALKVSWERASRLSPRDAVVTGDASEADAPPAPPTSVEARAADPLLAKPLFVFVRDDPALCDGKCGGACQRAYDLDEGVFAQEKVALALRAFRTITMTRAEAEAEPVLGSGAEGEWPRLLIVDVARASVTALAGSDVTASRVYREMAKAVSRFYMERLDALVKGHQRILKEHDRLAQEEALLHEQKVLTTDERRAKDLDERLGEVDAARRDLERKTERLWTLTPREL